MGRVAAPELDRAVKNAPIVEGIFSLLGLGIYLLIMQHLAASYIFEKPEDSWLRIAWTWARGYRHRSWYAKVGKTFTLDSTPEPKPEPQGDD